MTDMIALPRTRMTVDQYLAWAQGQPGRYELLDGVVFAMSPEAQATQKGKRPFMQPCSQASERAASPATPSRTA